MVGNWRFSVLRNDASNGICLRMWFSVTGLPVSSPWKIGFLRCVMAVMRADRLQRRRRVVAGVFAERSFHHGLVHVDLELDHHLGGRRHFDVAGLALDEFDRRAAQAARDLPVIGLVVHLHLAGVGQDRIDADDQRGLGRHAHLLALGQILAEAMERLRRERERVLAENEKAIVADVRHAGFRILRHHDAGRDVGPAVLRAVGRDRKAVDVDVVAGDDDLVAGRVAVDHPRRDRIVETVEHLLQDRLLVGLERQQRLVAIRIDAADQRKLGAVVVEHDRRAGPSDRPASAPCRHRSARSAGRRRSVRPAGAARRGTGGNPDTALSLSDARSFGRWTCDRLCQSAGQAVGDGGAAFAAQRTGGRCRHDRGFALALHDGDRRAAGAVHRPNPSSGDRELARPSDPHDRAAAGGLRGRRDRAPDRPAT